MPRFQNPHQRAFAKHLRQNMTVAEKVLWYHLRAHRFRGLSIRRQAPVGPYIVDFVIPSQRLIIEVDGGQHAELDREVARARYLAAQGYRVLRFWNNDVIGRRTAVLEVLDREVGESGTAQDA